MAAETLASRYPPAPPRRSRARLVGVIALLVVVAVWLAAGRHRDQQLSPGPDFASARAVLDGLGAPVPGAVAVSERVYRPCADDACAEVVRVFAMTARPAFGVVVGELDDWAANQGLVGGGPWSCGGLPRAARSAAPIGDCSTRWRTPDDVAVEVHVRLPTRVLGSAPWTFYADEPVLAVWDHVVATRPGTG